MWSCSRLTWITVFNARFRNKLHDHLYGCSYFSVHIFTGEHLVMLAQSCRCEMLLV